MLKVLNNKYTVTPKADSDLAREFQALAAVTDAVFSIGGWLRGTNTYLSSVSSYNITSNTWRGDLPELIEARYSGSACVLGAMIYVFCGKNYSNRCINSIETIPVTSLVP